MVLNRGRNRCQPTLFTGDDIACLDNQVDEVRREVIVGEDGELSEGPIGTDKEVECWTNPLRDIVLDSGVKLEQMGKFDVVLFEVVDSTVSPVRQPPLR